MLALSTMAGGLAVTAGTASAASVFNCDVVVNADGSVTVSWDEIGQSSNYVVPSDEARTWVAGRWYRDATPNAEYTIGAWLAGVKHEATCSTPVVLPTVAVDEAVDAVVGDTISIDVTLNDDPSENVDRVELIKDGCAGIADVTLSAEGVLSGTAVAPGTCTVTYRLISTSGSTDTATVTINVTAPPVTLTCGYELVNNVPVLSWNDVNPDDGMYEITDSNGVVVRQAETSFIATGGESYTISALVNGTLVSSGDCGEAPMPVEPPVCASLDGPTWIREGSWGSYKVTLDKPAVEDMTFTVNVMNGSARNAGNASGKDRQLIMWGGYYVKAIFNNWGWHTGWEKIYGRIPPNYNRNLSGGEATVGPADQTWDFSARVGAGGFGGSHYTLTVKAGETMSDILQVAAWRERVVVDARVNEVGFREGNEYFVIRVANSTCGTNVTITDSSEYPYMTPIVIDLDGDGIDVSSPDASDLTYDLLGDGVPVRSGWTTDGFLVRDLDGSGRIENGSEMFGGAIGVGFGELAELDTNHDGKIDAADPGYRTLGVWVDTDHELGTDAGELHSLADAGVVSITTGYVWDGAEVNGNILGETSSAVMADGRTVDVVDVYFGTR